MNPHSLPFFLVSLSLTVLSYANNLQRGQEVYSQICVTCHGPNLDGGIGPSLVDAYWKHGDTSEAIMRSISKGIVGTEMIAYEYVYSEEDRQAVTDFILDKQEGNRQTLRSFYARDYFKGKRFSPELFDSVESISQEILPENFLYTKRMFDGVLRGQSKLFIKQAGKYRFNVGGGGRTSIWVNGEEMHYTNDQEKKNTHFNKDFHLEKGVYDLEVLHEEPTSFSMRFYARLQRIEGGTWMLTGKSLEGNTPKIVRPGTEAKVVRKWIEGLPPRTLLVLLPNQVMVAYDIASGQVLKAWKSALVNQTPSLDSRSQNESVAKGQEISGAQQTVLQGKEFSLKSYESAGDSLFISTLVDGVQKRIKVSPDGSDSFSISVQ
ncbi:MAG: cytochrome c [Verrucomicrobia bacterium]|nr:cytochrome c [Verrucomicrobiota bacterium]